MSFHSILDAPAPIKRAVRRRNSVPFKHTTVSEHVKFDIARVLKYAPGTKFRTRICMDISVPLLGTGFL